MEKVKQAYKKTATFVKTYPKTVLSVATALPLLVILLAIFIPRTIIPRDTSYITFYGFDDNDDGNKNYGTSTIAYPNFHKVATEDFGNFTHPSTFAGDLRVFSKGEVIYIPRLKKYYVLEDGCRQCTDDANFGRSRADLFIGGNTMIQGTTLSACQNLLTKGLNSNEAIIRNPAPDLEVDVTPIFVLGRGCYNPATGVTTM